MNMNMNKKIQEKYFLNTMFGTSRQEGTDPSSVTSTTHAIFDALLTGSISSGALLSFAMPQMQAWRFAHPKLFNRVVVPLALISVAPGLLSKVPSVWNYFCNYLLASVKIPTEEDMVLDVFHTWLQSKGSSRLPNRSSIAVAAHKGPAFHGNSAFQTFTHNGRVFMVTLAADKSTTIWTFGVLPKPIEELLAHIADENIKAAAPKVRIYAPQDGYWRIQAQKLNRQLDSVYLPKADKDKIVADLEVHLRKETREWFAQAGIPYKRGYLFHGEPGCGKSSLSLALAGHFNLRGIHTLSLLDPTLTEPGLMQLLKMLPPKGLLLLEDIDAAGLNREINGEVQADKEAAKAPFFAKTKISLSFVLNALDGTSSPEGHILIMTTNHIEALDSALIRPGRIDYRLEFRLTTEEQIREIFAKMYHNAPGVGPVLDAEKLEELTNAFAEHIPEDTFTPAELQGYIMIHRFDPQAAVDEAGTWVEEQVKTKKAKKESKGMEPAVGPVSPPNAPSSRQRRNSRGRRPPADYSPDGRGVFQDIPERFRAMFEAEIEPSVDLSGYDRIGRPKFGNEHEYDPNECMDYDAMILAQRDQDDLEYHHEDEDED